MGQKFQKMGGSKADSSVAVATAGTVEESRSPTEDDDPFEHIEYSECQTSCGCEGHQTTAGQGLARSSPQEAPPSVRKKKPSDADEFKPCSYPLDKRTAPPHSPVAANYKRIELCKVRDHDPKYHSEVDLSSPSDEQPKFSSDCIVNKQDLVLTNREIGTGSYGKVLHACYRSAPCAAKVPHSIFQKYLHGSQMLDKFTLECFRLSRIRSPRIVQFLGVCLGDEEQGPILLMELMKCDLTSRLESNPPLSKPAMLRIALDIAQGLAYLHGQSIAHRDLTGRNILLDDGMRAKIGDIGAACRVSPNSERTQCPGTVVYMPPEALSADTECETSIDMFSFGVLLVQLFTGEFPSPKDDCTLSEVERRKDHVELMYTAVGCLETIPILIHQCLSNDPDARPKASDACKVLEGVQCDDPPPPYSSWDDSQDSTPQEHVPQSTLEQRDSETQVEISQQEEQRDVQATSQPSYRRSRSASVQTDEQDLLQQDEPRSMESQSVPPLEATGPAYILAGERDSHPLEYKIKTDLTSELNQPPRMKDQQETIPPMEEVGLFSSKEAQRGEPNATTASNPTEENGTAPLSELVLGSVKAPASHYAANPFLPCDEQDDSVDTRKNPTPCLQRGEQQDNHSLVVPSIGTKKPDSTWYQRIVQPNGHSTAVSSPTEVVDGSPALHLGSSTVESSHDNEGVCPSTNTSTNPLGDESSPPSWPSQLSATESSESAVDDISSPAIAISTKGNEGSNPSVSDSSAILLDDPPHEEFKDDVFQLALRAEGTECPSSPAMPLSFPVVHECKFATVVPSTAIGLTDEEMDGKKASSEICTSADASNLSAQNLLQIVTLPQMFSGYSTPEMCTIIQDTLRAVCGNVASCKAPVKTAFAAPKLEISRFQNSNEQQSLGVDYLSLSSPTIPQVRCSTSRYTHTSESQILQPRPAIVSYCILGNFQFEGFQIYFKAKVQQYFSPSCSLQHQSLFLLACSVHAHKLTTLVVVTCVQKCRVTSGDLAWETLLETILFQFPTRNSPTIQPQVGTKHPPPKALVTTPVFQGVCPASTLAICYTTARSNKSASSSGITSVHGGMHRRDNHATSAPAGWLPNLITQSEHALSSKVYATRVLYWNLRPLPSTENIQGKMMQSSHLLLRSLDSKSDSLDLSIGVFPLTSQAVALWSSSFSTASPLSEAQLVTIRKKSPNKESHLLQPRPAIVSYCILGNFQFEGFQIYFKAKVQQYFSPSCSLQHQSLFLLACSVHVHKLTTLVVVTCVQKCRVTSGDLAWETLLETIFLFQFPTRSSPTRQPQVGTKHPPPKALVTTPVFQGVCPASTLAICYTTAVPARSNKSASSSGITSVHGGMHRRDNHATSAPAGWLPNLITQSEHALPSKAYATRVHYWNLRPLPSTENIQGKMMQSSHLLIRSLDSKSDSLDLSIGAFPLMSQAVALSSSSFSTASPLSEAQLVTIRKKSPNNENGSEKQTICGGLRMCTTTVHVSTPCSGFVQPHGCKETPNHGKRRKTAQRRRRQMSFPFSDSRLKATTGFQQNHDISSNVHSTASTRLHQWFSQSTADTGGKQEKASVKYSQPIISLAVCHLAALVTSARPRLYESRSLNHGSQPSMGNGVQYSDRAQLSSPSRLICKANLTEYTIMVLQAAALVGYCMLSSTIHTGSHLLVNDKAASPCSPSTCITDHNVLSSFLPLHLHGSGEPGILLQLSVSVLCIMGPQSPIGLTLRIELLTQLSRDQLWPLVDPQLVTMLTYRVDCWSFLESDSVHKPSSSAPCTFDRGVLRTLMARSGSKYPNLTTSDSTSPSREMTTNGTEEQKQKETPGASDENPDNLTLQQSLSVEGQPVPSFSTGRKTDDRAHLPLPQKPPDKVTGDLKQPNSHHPSDPHLEPQVPSVVSGQSEASARDGNLTSSDSTSPSREMTTDGGSREYSGTGRQQQTSRSKRKNKQEELGKLTKTKSLFHDNMPSNLESSATAASAHQQAPPCGIACGNGNGKSSKSCTKSVSRSSSSKQATTESQGGECSGTSSQQQTCGASGGGGDRDGEDNDNKGEPNSADEEEEEEEDEEKDEEELEKQKTETKPFSQDHMPSDHDSASQKPDQTSSRETTPTSHQHHTTEIPGDSDGNHEQRLDEDQKQAETPGASDNSPGNPTLQQFPSLEGQPVPPLNTGRKTDDTQVLAHSPVESQQCDQTSSRETAPTSHHHSTEVPADSDVLGEDAIDPGGGYEDSPNDPEHAQSVEGDVHGGCERDKLECKETEEAKQPTASLSASRKSNQRSPSETNRHTTDVPGDSDVLGEQVINPAGAGESDGNHQQGLDEEYRLVENTEEQKQKETPGASDESPGDPTLPQSPSAEGQPVPSLTTGRKTDDRAHLTLPQKPPDKVAGDLKQPNSHHLSDPHLQPQAPSVVSGQSQASARDDRDGEGDGNDGNEEEIEEEGEEVEKQSKPESFSQGSLPSDRDNPTTGTGSQHDKQCATPRQPNELAPVTASHTHPSGDVHTSGGQYLSHLGTSCGVPLSATTSEQLRMNSPQGSPDDRQVNGGRDRVKLEEKRVEETGDPDACFNSGGPSASSQNLDHNSSSEDPPTGSHTAENPADSSAPRECKVSPGEGNEASSDATELARPVEGEVHGGYEQEKVDEKRDKELKKTAATVSGSDSSQKPAKNSCSENTPTSSHSADSSGGSDVPRECADGGGGGNANGESDNHNQNLGEKEAEDKQRQAEQSSTSDESPSSSVLQQHSTLQSWPTSQDNTGREVDDTGVPHHSPVIQKPPDEVVCEMSPHGQPYSPTPEKGNLEKNPSSHSSSQPEPPGTANGENGTPASMADPVSKQEPLPDTLPNPDETSSQERESGGQPHSHHSSDSHLQLQVPGGVSGQSGALSGDGASVSLPSSSHPHVALTPLTTPEDSELTDQEHLGIQEGGASDPLDDLPPPTAELPQQQIDLEAEQGSDGSSGGDGTEEQFADNQILEIEVGSDTGAEVGPGTGGVPHKPQAGKSDGASADDLFLKSGLHHFPWPAGPGGVDGAQPGEEHLSTGSSDTATTVETCDELKYFLASISLLPYQFLLPADVRPFSKQVEPTGIGTTEEDESQQRVEAPAPETSRDPAQQIVSPSLQRVHQKETVVLKLPRSLLVCTVGGNQEMCYQHSVSHLLQVNASLRALLLGCGGMPVRLCTPWEMVEAEQGFVLSVGECLEVLALGDIGLQRKALSLLASLVDCRVICSQQGLLQCGDLTRCGALVDMENDVILVDVVRVCTTVSTPNSFLCKVMELIKTVLCIWRSYHCHDDESSEVGAKLQCAVDECSPYQAWQKDLDEHTLVNLLCRLLDIVNNT